FSIHKVIVSLQAVKTRGNTTEEDGQRIDFNVLLLQTCAVRYEVIEFPHIACPVILNKRLLYTFRKRHRFAVEVALEIIYQHENIFFSLCDRRHSQDV